MKLENLLESLTIEPPKELHQKVMKRVREIPKVATLGTTLGDVRIQRKESEIEELANYGDVLFEGDKLITDEGGKTFIIFKDGTQVWLNEKTTLEFNRSTRNIFLSIGEVLAFVTKRSKGTGEFVIGTPAGLVEVLGTEFDTTVSKEQITILTVLEGVVKFKNEKGEAQLKKNTQSRAKPETQPTVPIKVETTQVVAWAGDLVSQSRGIYIPKQLKPKNQEKLEKPIIKWALILLLLGGILGYILGYLYGKF